MRKLHSSAWLACLVGGVAFASACGGDEDSDNPNNGSGGSAGKGGSSAKGGSGGSKGGKGGSSGSGGSAGKGGSSAKGGSGGSSGAGEEGGKGAEAGDGSGNTGNTGGSGEAGETGNGGGSGGEVVNPPVGCDIYADRGEPVDIPTLDGDVIFDGDDDGDDDALTLTSDKTWRINGRSYVGAGKTLHIQPCTLVVGSRKGSTAGAGSLFITRGAKIEAVGSKDEPIVFSSDDFQFHPAAPWGGLVLLGNAPIGEGSTAPTGEFAERGFEGLDPNDLRNVYGGNDPADDSGTLSYVRIEYGGDIIAGDKEINGLTFAGVGNATGIDHIMVKRQRDDCFEWFGGTVNADHLICENTGDDMFDTDETYKGYIQFLFGRLTLSGTSSDPNGFEWDGNQQNAAAADRGTPHAANATLCGYGSSLGPVAFGALLRRGLQAGTTLTNTIVTGFNNGVDTRDAVGTTDPLEPLINWNHSLFFENFTNNIAIAEVTGAASDNDSAFDELLWINDPAALNGSEKPEGFDCGSDNLGEGPRNPFPTTRVDGAAAGEGFKDPSADYVGAFEDADDNWMTGAWVDWSTGG